MFIAQKLKKENIAEYILYMWQIEELMRAFNMDMLLVNERIVQTFPVQTEAERKLLYDWYESIIEMMRNENVSQSGHIQLNRNVITQLDEFHLHLLKSGKVPAYNSKFYYILPFINTLRKKSVIGLNDMEIVLNFMYGIIVLKMKKAEISPETLQSKEEIGKFLKLLAENYKMYQKGNLDLEN